MVSYCNILLLKQIKNRWTSSSWTYWLNLWWKWAQRPLFLLPYVLGNVYITHDLNFVRILKIQVSFHKCEWSLFTLLNYWRYFLILCYSWTLAEKSCWPSVKTLFLLRLWSLIFPCSDFRHVVMTPAILLMSEYLMRCPITSGRDVAIGSFLCSMVLSVRYSPKLIYSLYIFYTCIFGIPK